MRFRASSIAEEGKEEDSASVSETASVSEMASVSVSGLTDLTDRHTTMTTTTITTLITIDQAATTQEGALASTLGSAGSNGSILVAL